MRLYSVYHILFSWHHRWCSTIKAEPRQSFVIHASERRLVAVYHGCNWLVDLIKSSGYLHLQAWPKCSTHIMTHRLGRAQHSRCSIDHVDRWEIAVLTVAYSLISKTCKIKMTHLNTFVLRGVYEYQGILSSERVWLSRPSQQSEWQILRPLWQNWSVINVGPMLNHYHLIHSLHIFLLRFEIPLRRMIILWL
jgi:hypothetical protein